MKVVIVHYHLNRGGVTSVIKSHLRALSTLEHNTPERVVVAHGGRTADWDDREVQDLPFPVELTSLQALEYDNERDNKQDSDGSLFIELEQLLDRAGCQPDSTVLHVHNHGLGKNRALAPALRQLANSGWRFLLHLHDFVEDLRPTNYLHLLDGYARTEEMWKTLYPQAEQIRYATLNHRDFEFLTSAGIDPRRLELLPNPVEVRQQHPAADKTSQVVPNQARDRVQELLGVPAGHRYVLYPVRGIRRKNLGEILLWATLLDGCSFSLSLAPLNEQELPAYTSWQQFAQQHSLPVFFGSGESLSLSENYRAADAIISTSVAEGFGLVFLEASLRKRMLFGRNLPSITADFVNAGLQFPGLANEFLVPATSIDRSALRRDYEQWAHKLRTDYGLPAWEAADLTHSLNELLDRDAFDFGRLTSKQQRQVIMQLQNDRQLKNQIIELNPCIEHVTHNLEGQTHDLKEAVLSNCEIIGREYSLAKIGDKLGGIYQNLLECVPDSVEVRPDIARNLLNQFLSPERLIPIRLEA